MNNLYKKLLMPAGYISTYPLPEPEELEKFYAETYYQTPSAKTYQESYEQLEIDYKNLKCDALLHALQQHSLLGEKTLLDVGAGEGFLMNAAERNGFDVVGLDFSAYGVGKFFPHLLERHKAGDIFKSLSDFISRGKRFSLCTVINVLEHVLDPNCFLRLIGDVVQPGGLIALTVPNDYSCIQQLALEEKMIEEEFWFVPPHHLHYFNADNFLAYVKEMGMEVLDAFSDFPVDLFLLHSGSNYAVNQKNGWEANRARMLHDIMIFNKNGLSKYLDYYRAMFNVGIGRDITIIVRPNKV